MFSMGAIIYEILSGRKFAIDCKYIEKIRAKESLNFEFDDKNWSSISD
jgi:hypothetical protein